MNLSILKKPNDFLFYKNTDNLKETFTMTEDNLYSIFEQNNLNAYEKEKDTEILKQSRIEYDYVMDDNIHTRLFLVSISLIGVWVIYGLYTRH